MSETNIFGKFTIFKDRLGQLSSVKNKSDTYSILSIFGLSQKKYQLIDTIEIEPIEVCRFHLIFPIQFCSRSIFAVQSTENLWIYQIEEDSKIKPLRQISFQKHIHGFIIRPSISSYFYHFDIIYLTEYYLDNE